MSRYSLGQSLVQGILSLSLGLAATSLLPEAAHAAKKVKLVKYSCSSASLSSCNSGSAMVFKGNTAQIDVLSEELQKDVAESQGLGGGRKISGNIMIRGIASASTGVRNLVIMVRQHGRTIEIFREEFADRPKQREFAVELKTNELLENGGAGLILSMRDGSEACQNRKKKAVSCSDTANVASRWTGYAELERSINVEDSTRFRDCVAEALNSDRNEGVCIKAPEMDANVIRALGPLHLKGKAVAARGLGKITIFFIDRDNILAGIQSRQIIDPAGAKVMDFDIPVDVSGLQPGRRYQLNVQSMDVDGVAGTGGATYQTGIYLGTVY